jgi:hypothetical protein
MLKSATNICNIKKTRIYGESNSRTSNCTGFVVNGQDSFTSRFVVIFSLSITFKVVVKAAL